ncbi:3-oxoadipate enol-lactonase [Lutibaculum baratangense]|uniref:Beta-ketoadipate enol-lactone hydrolase n=1 Tax=Lutibaculum baratangense AMV1 TaxID=631454 RepID=V4R8H1_9HYPH|nr:3-oxoadipate enol-lactonase [Lutibaculum baratangense]ESR22466.1 Beta-ketoadipate enol-lactone hydrolase [Lutibaculum baratangense AMV1]
MSTLDIENATIHYELSGREGAPLLVLSNSLGTNLSMWDAQVAHFGDRYRILRYDQRGHGRSSAPPGEYSFGQLGRDVVALMDYLGVEKAHFCGLSMGGMTGMWLGVHAPHRVDRLVLANTAAFLPPKELWDGRVRTVTEKGMGAIVDAVVERWFSPEFQASDPDEVARVRAMILATLPAGYAGCCAAIRDMDQREDIRSIRVPTLVICGSKDPATPPAQAEEIVGHVPQARLVTLEAAHLSNIEDPAGFNQAVARFLSEEQG